jgi:aldose 1-epimerase
MTEICNLQNDRLAIEVEPGRGGSLRSFRGRVPTRGVDWIDIFQNVNTAGPGSWAYFAMLPYTARIYNGVFPWANSDFRVTPVRNSQHAIHGPGRQHPWTVVKSSNESILLRLSSADYRDTFVYPSDCELNLSYQIVDDVLHIVAKIANVGSTDMPVGGGSHPFIPKLLAGCTKPPVLQFDAKCRYLPREDTPGEAMPDGRTEEMRDALSFEHGRTPADGWDHCIGGWSKIATAKWEEIGIGLCFEDRDTNSEGFAHLWFPAGRDVWAFEQEIAIGNAFNLAVPSGMRILKPGESTGFHHTFALQAL